MAPLKLLVSSVSPGISGSSTGAGTGDKDGDEGDAETGKAAEGAEDAAGDEAGGKVELPGFSLFEAAARAARERDTSGGASAGQDEAMIVA